LKDGFVVNTILKEADLFCPNSVRINFTIYLILTTLLYLLLDYLMLTFPPVEGVAQNVPLILLPFCYFLDPDSC
ncbi:hypothetical protein, partial [Latilactobacillus curvatus]|uniref:hypothetical protein n=1 Tax=Latilactobacillus curvatus TaxID=28038 RepID=UPI00223B72C0